MEDLGILDPDRDNDLFALHYVFIPRINIQLLQFMEAWNHHPEHGLSPLQLWHRGMLSASPRCNKKLLMDSVCHLTMELRKVNILFTIFTIRLL